MLPPFSFAFQASKLDPPSGILPEETPEELALVISPEPEPRAFNLENGTAIFSIQGENCHQKCSSSTSEKDTAKENVTLLSLSGGTHTLGEEDRQCSTVNAEDNGDDD